MSMETNGKPAAPFQQWQNFYPPYAYEPKEDYAAMAAMAAISSAERNLTTGQAGLSKDVGIAALNLRDAVERNSNANIDAVTNVERYMNTGHAGLSKDIGMASLGVRDAVERTSNANIDAVTNVERYIGTGHAGLTKDIHQTTLGLRDAVEKGTYANGHSIERNANLLSSAIERNGGTIMTAIEKVAGEQRLTTTVTDAASRQAAADSARDLAIAIERNGANSVNASQNTNTLLLGSIERNAGEGRVTTVTSQAALDGKLTDVRHSILNDVNRVGTDMISNNVQSLNVLTKHVTDGAWETRQAMGNGFSDIGLSIVKGHADLQKSTGDYYASILLEQQKMGQFLASKSDSQFAQTQIELLKSKSELSAQSAQQFAIGQLEQQKMGSIIAAQMAEARYDSLKNTQDLGKQIAECCCALKEKNDGLDRERLRDGLNNANNDNNMLKVLEQARQGSGPLGQGILGGYGYPGVGPFGAGMLGGYGFPGVGPNVGGYSEGHGNVHVYERGRRHGRRSRSRSRSRSRD